MLHLGVITSMSLTSLATFNTGTNNRERDKEREREGERDRERERELKETERERGGVDGERAKQISLEKIL